MDILTACKRFPRALLAGMSSVTTGVGRAFKISEVHLGRCQLCGNMRLIKAVAFYRNVGMLFSRQTIKIQGDMCKSCVHKHFWEYTLKNLLLGPWGLISVIATPIYGVMNIGSYAIALFKLRDALE